MTFICPCCGYEASIKDNDRFSSIMCQKRIIIYYYDFCTNVEISKEDYLEYKKSRKVKNNGNKT